VRLLDSNIIIYASAAGSASLNILLKQEVPAVSAVSLIEVLGFSQLTIQNVRDFEEFFAIVPILPIDEPVVLRAIELRQRKKMSLGDAIIAATALVHNLVLVTRNTKDFTWIDGLNLIDPFVDLRTQ
jgi:predicted nucleic acid-binding protein